MYCENSESLKSINVESLGLLHYGAFLHYFNNCQFFNTIAVNKYCDQLCNDWRSLPPDLQDLIRFKLKEAWQKEQDYGKHNSIISPFGDHQEIWYRVIEKLEIL